MKYEQFPLKWTDKTNVECYESNFIQWPINQLENRIYQINLKSQRKSCQYSPQISWYTYSPNVEPNPTSIIIIWPWFSWLWRNTKPNHVYANMVLFSVHVTRHTKTHLNYKLNSCKVLANQLNWIRLLFCMKSEKEKIQIYNSL